ncbi:MAG TPA: nucleotidyltransferase domain-containing protein [Longimicrobiales bacterium]|nr:nucleotidyltransferase domain-containing protein [Longimicrobiales bacterium]
MTKADPERMARRFVADLQGDLGERLDAAILFGSAARGEWIEGVSDINVLVLVRDMNARLLADASATCVRWAESGVVPLFMAGDEWARAHDVFGIELSDIRDAHVAILGSDPTVDVHVPPETLRLQAEREIRSKLLHLHGALLLAAPDPTRIGQLLRRSLPSFVTYLRTALRLDGKPVPASMDAVIETGCALIDTRPDAFRTVLAARPAHDWAVAIDDPIVDEYNEAAERLAAFIDIHGR